MQSGIRAVMSCRHYSCHLLRPTTRTKPTDRGVPKPLIKPVVRRAPAFAVKEYIRGILTYAKQARVLSLFALRAIRLDARMNAKYIGTTRVYATELRILLQELQ